MSANPVVREKYGQLIFADTSLAVALQQSPAHAVSVPMIVPLVPEGDLCLSPKTKGAQKTMGGFMGVPLVGARFGASAISEEQVKDYCKRVCVDHILLVIDTGSEGYFVTDDTGGRVNGEEVEPFLRFCNIQSLPGSASMGMSLTVGGAENFTIEHPFDWFMASPEEIAQTPAASGARTQSVIVGNCWLQALCVTWNAPELTVSFSHLDGNGHRCSSFQYGAQRQQNAPRASPAAAQKPSMKNFIVPTSSLSRTHRVFAAQPARKAPLLDTAVDLRFMAKVSAKTDDDAEVILSWHGCKHAKLCARSWQ